MRDGRIVSGESVRPRLWLRFAWRDLRSGLHGFWIFLTCLALGTAAIAIVGSLTAAIDRGISEQGQPLLGGDLEASLIHREAPRDALAFLEGKGRVSTVAALRAMAITGEKTTLVEIKAADDRYPLYGTLVVERRIACAALAACGSPVSPSIRCCCRASGSRLATTSRSARAFRDTHIIATEPDRISDGIVIGPRVLMSAASPRPASSSPAASSPGNTG